MNLIGISGRINSGKDTVAKIIQYLQLPSLGVDDIVKVIVMNKSYPGLGFEIKKFADRLKDIVCLLLDCTRERLEDRDFKDKVLGVEWDKWVVYSSYAVDCDNAYSHDDYNEPVYFATENEALEHINDLSSNPSYEWHEPELIQMTPRLLMQVLGTECGRNLIHPNIWVNLLFNEYSDKSKWLITDVRFHNEADSIKQKGGFNIKVVKQDPDELCRCGTKFSEHNLRHPFNSARMLTEHFSEQALDDYKNFDAVIENNGTVKDLIRSVERVIIDNNLIKDYKSKE